MPKSWAEEDSIENWDTLRNSRWFIMARRTRTLTPATVGLGVVLSLFSTLQSSKLVCALVRCGDCKTELRTEVGEHLEKKCCCHSKATRVAGHSHRVASESGCRHGSMVSSDHAPIPLSSCPCSDSCVCKSDPGPSIPTQSVHADATTQLSIVCGTADDGVANAHRFSWHPDFPSGRRGAFDICVILCRFRA